MPDQPMEERIAKVLAEHRYKVEQAVCSCSDFVQVGLRCDDQTHEQHVAAVVARIVLEAMYPMVRNLTDPDDCSFDHHGGCQAHGYLSLGPGEICPQLEAKAWLHNNPYLEEAQ